METDDDGDSETYREIYGVQLLDDIHNYLPAILYNHQRFHTIGNLLEYVRSRAEELNGYQFHESQAAWVRRRQGQLPRLNLRERRRQDEDEDEDEESGDEESQEEDSIPLPPLRPPFLENVFHPQSLLTPFLLPPQRRLPSTLVETLFHLAAPGLGMPTSPYGFAATTTTQTIPPNFFDPVPIIPTTAQVDAASVHVTADISACEQVCSICQENFRLSDPQRFLLHCAHTFHVRCIDRWFESNVRCPLCRHDIRDMDDSAYVNADTETDSL